MNRLRGGLKGQVGKLNIVSWLAQTVSLIVNFMKEIWNVAMSKGLSI